MHQNNQTLISILSSIKAFSFIVFEDFVLYARTFSCIINEKFAPLFKFFHVITKKPAHSARLFHPALLLAILE
jgi:hypothetical protein